MSLPSHVAHSLDDDMEDVLKVALLGSQQRTSQDGDEQSHHFLLRDSHVREGMAQVHEKLAGLQEHPW